MMMNLISKNRIWMVLTYVTVTTSRMLHYRKSKGKGKVHPRTGHEAPEGEKMYSSTLPSTSALDGGGWVVNAMPQLLYPPGRPSTHCAGGLVGPRASLDGCGKSRPHQDSIPRPSSP